MIIRATVYKCHRDSDVMIKLCELEGNPPEFWFLHRPGEEDCYWNGREWRHSTPKQFSSAEEAYQEWEDKIYDPDTPGKVAYETWVNSSIHRSELFRNWNSLHPGKRAAWEDTAQEVLDKFSNAHI